MGKAKQVSEEPENLNEKDRERFLRIFDNIPTWFLYPQIEGSRLTVKEQRGNPSLQVSYLGFSEEIFKDKEVMRAFRECVSPDYLETLRDVAPKRFEERVENKKEAIEEIERILNERLLVSKRRP